MVERRSVKSAVAGSNPAAEAKIYFTIAIKYDILYVMKKILNIGFISICFLSVPAHAGTLWNCYYESTTSVGIGVAYNRGEACRLALHDCETNSPTDDVCRFVTSFPL